MNYNIFAALATDLQDFFQNKIHIAGVDESKEAKYLARGNNTYEFSQWQTLNQVVMFYNSKFTSGEKDSEGQRKVFLNISKFRADVAAKQTDLDVKDFVFVPTDGASEWPAYFMTRKFREWARAENFGEVINEINIDYSKLGSAVLKKVGEKIERVPLMSLRVQQDAKSLKDARYVIEEHKDMYLDEIQEYSEWDTEGLELEAGEKTTVYERYAKVPRSFYNEYKDLKSTKNDDKEMVDCLAILTLTPKKVADKWGGSILFLEEVKERPYEELHWSRQDGRWLGIGEIENQFENQIMRNMTANMLRRGLMWSSKKIFQSSDTELAKNLVRDVKDGDVLKVMPTGQVSQVNMNTQNLAEFSTANQEWDKNSDQKSFTYEVATGEALPSGTPFRLGVVLSNAVNSHFALKREQEGLFWSRVVDNLLYPVFKKRNQETHSLLIGADEEGAERLKQEMIKINTSAAAMDQLLNGVIPDLLAIKAKVEAEIQSRKNLEVIVPDKFYDVVKASTTVVITGENINIEKRLETYTNLYTSMVQRGDPAAQVVLKKILSLTGENYDALVGVNQGQGMGQPMAQPMNPMQPAGQPDMQAAMSMMGQ